LSGIKACQVSEVKYVTQAVTDMILLLLLLLLLAVVVVVVVEAATAVVKFSNNQHLAVDRFGMTLEEVNLHTFQMEVHRADRFGMTLEEVKLHIFQIEVYRDI